MGFNEITTNQLLELPDAEFIQYLADTVLEYRRAVAVARSRLNPTIATQYNHLILHILGGDT
jgi:hypothetical protein